MTAAKTRTLTLHEILKIIVGECRNACSSEVGTWQHFERWNESKHNNGVLADMEMVRTVIRMLNFAGIRENSRDLWELFSESADRPYNYFELRDEITHEANR